MFKIGDFSKFTCVSIKMLRHYDAIGLLKPAYADPQTGYRYYLADQLPRLNRIISLKELGFTLEQVICLMDSDLSTEKLKVILKAQRKEVLARLRAEEIRLAGVDLRLWQLEQGTPASAYDVLVREVPSCLMATLPHTVSESEIPFAALFDEVEGYVAAYHARAFASPMALIYDHHEENPQKIEIAVPVTRRLAGNDRIQVCDIQGGKMACVVYTGTDARTREALDTLRMWTDRQKYTVVGPLREVYLRFGADHVEELDLPLAFLSDSENAYITELQLPIER